MTNEVTFREGDIIRVNEAKENSPWIIGPWRGRVKKLILGGHAYVEPLDVADLKFRVRVPPTALKNGLYLMPTDILGSTLLERAPVDA